MHMRRDNGRNRTREAFTLIELLVVMTIIGILAAIILPRVIANIGGAKQTVAKNHIIALEGRVLEFYTDCGRLPDSQEGLGALIHAPADLEGKWKGPYVTKESDIIDPWGREFKLRSPGEHIADFDIFTYGADGQEGGEDENADVGNW